MMVALESLGWEFCEPALFKDQNRDDVYLRTGDPKRLRKMLERRLEELHEQEVEKAAVNRHCCTEAQAAKVKEFGIDFEATRKVLRSKRTTRRAANIVTQLAAGTYPIGRHLNKMGGEHILNLSFL